MRENLLHIICFVFTKHDLFQEAEIRAIEADIKLMKSGELKMEAEDETPRLQALRSENSKLKYQRMHLQRVWAVVVFTH